MYKFCKSNLSMLQPLFIWLQLTSKPLTKTSQYRDSTRPGEQHMANSFDHQADKPWSSLPASPIAFANTEHGKQQSKLILGLRPSVVCCYSNVLLKEFLIMGCKHRIKAHKRYHASNFLTNAWTKTNVTDTNKSFKSSLVLRSFVLSAVSDQLSAGFSL